jgi:hypothetical protein
LGISKRLFIEGQEEIMKYLVLGYMEEKRWDDMPEKERNEWMEECFGYDALLKKNGHYLGGEALDTIRNCKTLKAPNGKISITDGPFAETKEQLGGIMLLEANDIDEAVELISKHPALRDCTFEIRSIVDVMPEDFPRISDLK